MSKNLLIVESPAKAKTIEKILGKDFTVKSSYGHVRDLDKKSDGVDVNNNYKPKYIVSPDKQRVVKELKEWVKKVDTVWLATDEDREGEAISWHLCKVLGLDEHTTKRIVFREITAPAIKKAIQIPRTVDLNLVNAQQARRILDRLVGFELSGLLWKKVRGQLSAGRVQSVAVKLIVERERNIQQFESTPHYKVSALFDVKNEQGRVVKLKAELAGKFDAEKEAQDFLNKANGAIFKINDIKVRPTKRKPTAPFTTSTLQQEASRKLGFSVKRTMINAQKLYEQGHITYMRTDSVSMSEVALAAIAQEIEDKYGSQYVETRRYKTKKQDAQEAHEAIRPSRIQNDFVTTDRDQQRLYELIWKRTIASQMADAQLEKTTVKIGISSLSQQLTATGEVMKFDGFLKVYLESKDEEEDGNGEESGILPPLNVGQVLDLYQMTATERFTRSQARFTEAMLVKKLEELGIGRPSTYAPTISRIMEPSRGYVIKDSRDGKPRNFNIYTLQKNTVSKKVETERTGVVKNRLFPTDIGMIVCDFLDLHFDNIMDYGFTAAIEERFDDIAGGKESWTEMLDSFYKPFHQDVEKTLETAERASGERILGKDPDTGRTLLVRMTRRGPVVQIGAQDELAEDEKPRYGNLRKGQSLETITFDEAIRLFELPKVVGTHLDKDLTIGIGRFGPYVRHGDDLFVSLGRDEEPLDVTLERAIELVDEKIKADAPVATYKGFAVTKGKGRFGPFLKWNDMFINIPRRYEPATISDADMFELIDAKEKKEANRYIHKFEDIGLSVENARWGPLVRFKKTKIDLRHEDGKRMVTEDAAAMTLEQFKAIIEEKVPDAFKKKAPKKKAAKKKAPKKKK